MAPLDGVAALAKLDELYDFIPSITAKSADSDFEKFTAFFTDDCDCNIRSMREFPTTGRKALLDDAKDLFQSYQLLSRSVDSQAVSEHGDATTVFCQMSNKVDVLGDVINPFQETAVVTFEGNTGLISKFKLYSCRSPVVRILQEKTNLGPYSEEYMATDEPLPGIQPKTKDGLSCCR